MTPLRSAAAIGVLLAAACAAAPDNQLVASIENGLAQQGIGADLSRLTPEQTTALYLELSSPTGDPGDEVRSRQKLISILRRNPDTEPFRL